MMSTMTLVQKVAYLKPHRTQGIEQDQLSQEPVVQWRSRGSQGRIPGPNECHNNIKSLSTP